MFDGVRFCFILFDFGSTLFQLCALAFRRVSARFEGCSRAGLAGCWIKTRQHSHSNRILGWAVFAGLRSSGEREEQGCRYG